MKPQSMNCAVIGPMLNEFWGDENSPDSTWSLCNIHATFSHKDACEFIFHLPSGYREHYKALGFNDDFIDILTDAYTYHYKYVCIYS